MDEINKTGSAQSPGAYQNETDSKTGPDNSKIIPKSIGLTTRQCDIISSNGLNASRLVRDLLADYFFKHNLKIKRR